MKLLLLDGLRLKQSPESSFTNLRKKNKKEERIQERREKTIEKYNQLNNIKNFIKKEEPKYMGTTTSQSEF